METEKRYSPDIAEQKYQNNLKAKGAPLKIGNGYNLANYIEKRPGEINRRTSFGHWEMDCVCGRTKAVLLVLTERLTRKEIIFKMKNQTKTAVVQSLDILEERYSENFRKIFKSFTNLKKT